MKIKKKRRPEYVGKGNRLLLSTAKQTIRKVSYNGAQANQFTEIYIKKVSWQKGNVLQGLTRCPYNPYSALPCFLLGLTSRRYATERSRTIRYAQPLRQDEAPPTSLSKNKHGLHSKPSPFKLALSLYAILPRRTYT